MKNLIVVAVLVLAQLVVAGGIVTNSNQSAQFVRSLSRNASSEIDATYFNPAGLTQLADGWHFALYNQTIIQEKKVENNFKYLQNKEFVGEVNVPVFPDFYATFKKDKLAISFGFGPNGGGGTAEFAQGLPSFEIPISTLIPKISAAGMPTTAYKTDNLSFDGSSVYYGFQVNGSYAITPKISAAVGVRYISANNKYEGSITNIQVNPYHPQLNPTSAFISAQGLFTMLGMTEQAAQVADTYVDVTQTATGITPIIGLNFKPMEALNIGFKYEFNTGLEFTNETTVDGSGMFPDGQTFNNDIPALLALGAEYAFVPQFRGSLSYTLYFDKSADWDGREELVDNNFFELGVGLEYDISSAFLISAGFLTAQTGVSEAYNNAISHSLSSNTVGFGLRYTLGGAWDIDLGTLYTMYSESQRSGSEPLSAAYSEPYTETYNRSNVAVAIGLGYHF